MIVLVPCEFGVHVAVLPGVIEPSATLVQFSIGRVTGNWFPRTSILVALMNNNSSAVIVGEELVRVNESSAP